MIEIHSEVSQPDPTGIVDAEYDLVLAAGTWDSRCTAMTHSEGLRTEHSAIIHYADKGAGCWTKQNTKAIESFLKAHSSQAPVAIDIDSFQALTAWDHLRSHIISVYNLIGRPLRVLLDLASIPRFLSLAVLGFGMRSGLLHSFDVVYASTTSYSAPVQSPGDFTDASSGFTSGHWRAMPVLGLGIGGRGRGRNHLMVSVGFEGAKTRKLVDVLEPDELSLLVAGSPGNQLYEYALEQNRSLCDKYLVGNDSVIGGPIFGMLETTKIVRSYLNCFVSESTEVSVLVTGPKPHALALALVALQHPIANYYYALPDRHLETTPTAIAAYHHVRILGTWVPRPEIG